MRYEFSDYEWTAIKPMIPNKPNGARRGRYFVSFCARALSGATLAVNERTCPRQPSLEWERSESG